MLWTGKVGIRGYGMTRAYIGRENGKPRHVYFYAHRAAWEIERGPIPAGLTIDHLCFTKLCVNVGHLELVPNAENLGRYLDRKNGSRYLCVRGHDRRISDNWDDSRSSCRVCERESTYLRRHGVPRPPDTKRGRH